MSCLVCDRGVQDHFLHLLLENKPARIVRALIWDDRRLLLLCSRLLVGWFLGRSRRRCSPRRAVDGLRWAGGVFCACAIAHRITANAIVLSPERRKQVVPKCIWASLRASFRCQSQ